MSDDLVKRLRGEYRIPITDGLGAAGGAEPNNPYEYVRRFKVPPIQKEAADRIEALEARVAAADALAEAMAEAMDCTVLITQALEDGAFSDPYAWAFEDALSEQCEALAAYRKTQEGEQ